MKINPFGFSHPGFELLRLPTRSNTHGDITAGDGRQKKRAAEVKGEITVYRVAGFLKKGFSNQTRASQKTAG